jgi:hypothetical protein
MDEDKFLSELATPLFFDVEQVGLALDNYDIADPHRRADEFDDKHTAPLVNQPLYDTSISTVIKKNNMSLGDFPDISDSVLSDYRLQKMMGHDVEMPNFVDLDTARDYSSFLQNTVDSLLASENEFLASSTTAAT